MNHPKTIMIIEDDHDTRVALRNCFEHEGYFVVSTADGQSALSLLKTMTAPSVIITDIVMPVMNGDQLIRALKRDPLLATIPIIQISAAETAQREGTFCVVHKPLDLGVMLKQIRTCLDTLESSHSALTIQTAEKEPASQNGLR